MRSMRFSRVRSLALLAGLACASLASPAPVHAAPAHPVQTAHPAHDTRDTTSAPVAPAAAVANLANAPAWARGWCGLDTAHVVVVAIRRDTLRTPARVAAVIAAPDAYPGQSWLVLNVGPGPAAADSGGPQCLARLDRVRPAGAAVRVDVSTPSTSARSRAFVRRWSLTPWEAYTRAGALLDSVLALQLPAPPAAPAAPATPS